MDTAIVWYQSRALWALVAALLLAAATKFHIVLPSSVTNDAIVSFFLQVAPIVVAIYERVTANKIITPTAQKAADINATTIKISAADAPTISATPQILPLLMLAPLLGVMMLLSACSTFGAPKSVAQGLFAAYGTYDAAVTAANTYAQSPGANKTVVHALATAYDASKPARDLVIAYRTCVVSKQTTVTIGTVVMPCGSYDFSTASLLQVETALRNAALTLQQITPSK